MLKLTNRLKRIADFIEPGETVADIGTDHGFLPIALWESGKSPQVILSDVNQGPLEKAKENIIKYYPGKEFDLRIGNGMQTLEPGEVDVLVIAGMGGLLISDILSDDIEKTRTYKKIILQPRNNQIKLRAWLLENGFTIKDEALVKEGNYICEIIVAEPFGPAILAGLDDITLEISPILFQKKDPLIVELIEKKIRIEFEIYRKIKEESEEKNALRMRKAIERIELLRNLADEVLEETEE